VTIHLLHPAGPNRRALCSYLASEGHQMVEHLALRDFVRSLRDAPDSAGLLHLGVFATVALAQIQGEEPAGLSSIPDSLRDRILVVVPEGFPRVTKGPMSDEPYHLVEVEKALRSLASSPSNSAPGVPDPARGDCAEPAPSGQREHEAILGAIGRALTPHSGAAEGWLQLLVQDIPPDDPAHRHIGHARRELRALDRVLRLFLLADEATPTFEGSLSLPLLVREVVRGLGVTSVPIALEFSEEISEVKADPKLTRHALESLIRGILEPAGRPESLEIRAVESGSGVELILAEQGCRLEEDQQQVLCAPGRSLLYNSFGRGLGFPLAQRLFSRQGIDMQVSTASNMRLDTRVRFHAAEDARLRVRPGSRRQAELEEGAS
jgi:hypothetical protein